MGKKSLIIGILVLSSLAIAGFFVFNGTLMNQGSSNIGENEDSASNQACESSLNSLTQLMESGDTREIPDSCFSDGELVTDRFSDAEPGDSFSKTSDGIEVVQ